MPPLSAASALVGLRAAASGRQGGEGGNIPASAAAASAAAAAAARATPRRGRPPAPAALAQVLLAGPTLLLTPPSPRTSRSPVVVAGRDSGAAADAAPAAGNALPDSGRLPAAVSGPQAEIESPPRSAVAGHARLVTAQAEM